MKNRLKVWRKQRRLGIDDLIGVIKMINGLDLSKEGIYQLDRGSIKLKERHIRDLDNKFKLTNTEKELLHEGTPFPEVEQPLHKVASTSNDLMYVITLENGKNVGILGKELLQTRLFTEITHHCCLDNPSGTPKCYDLIICRTRITNTNVDTINDFLKKIEPVIKKYRDSCNNTESITSILFSKGYKQT